MSSAANWIASGEDQSEFRRVEALGHWQAPEAVRFWEQRPADGIVIGRDIPSRGIARLLNRVLIYEPSDERRDLKVHLAGSAIRYRFGRDVTGLRMSELFRPEEYPIRFRAVMEAIERNEPRMALITHGTKDFEVLRLELLMLPVIAPNGSDRWGLVFCFYF
jgi:hypothetical protein